MKVHVQQGVVPRMLRSCRLLPRGNARLAKQQQQLPAHHTIHTAQLIYKHTRDY